MLQIVICMENIFLEFLSDFELQLLCKPNPFPCGGPNADGPSSQLMSGHQISIIQSSDCTLSRIQTSHNQLQIHKSTLNCEKLGNFLIIHNAATVCHRLQQICNVKGPYSLNGSLSSNRLPSANIIFLKCFITSDKHSGWSARLH